MRRKYPMFFMAMAMLLFRGTVLAQIPVEVFAGTKKATVDVLFFRYIKSKENRSARYRGRLLFFNRNRASMDYKMTASANGPQFGFTEAVSYNHEKLKGLAPVVVLSILNRGVYSKAGIQFAKIKTNLTVFSWVVAETRPAPQIDFFLLVKYTPAINGKLNLFTQAELVNVFPTVRENNFSFTQRLRLGLKWKAWQFGAGLDLLQLGRQKLVKTENAGGFLRHEF